MARWTTTHPFPLELNGRPIPMSEVFRHTIAHNNLIWTGCFSDDFHYDNLLYKFNPGTGEFEKFYFNTPGEYTIDKMVGCENILYIFTKVFARGTAHNYKIYQFNIQTSITTEFLDFRCGRILGNPQARNGLIYVLEDNERKKSLLAIDTSSKTIKHTELNLKLNNRYFTSHYIYLLVKDEQLYLFNDRYYDRFVSLIDENNQVHILSRTNREDRSLVLCNGIDESIVFPPSEGTPQDEWRLETYDFEKRAWRESQANGRWEFPILFPTQPILAVKIENTIFAHVRARSEDGRCRWVIAALELEPTLTDICLLNMAKEVSEENSKENVLNRVPIGLRSRLANLIDYRDWTPGPLIDESNPDDDFELESDTDSDTELNTESDTESDAESNMEADTESDTELDTESNMELDTESDTESDSESDTEDEMAMN